MTKKRRQLVTYYENRELPAKPQAIVDDGELVLEKIGEPGLPGPVDAASLTVWERRAAVAVLLGAGWTKAQMAKRLKVCATTIGRDIKDVRLRAADDGMGITVKEIAGQLTLRLEYQYRKTVELFEQIKDPRTRLAAIKMCLAIQMQQLMVYERLGFKTGETDRRRFQQEVTATTMVKVQQMMVVVERHVDESDRHMLADEWKQILQDIPLHTIDVEVT